MADASPPPSIVGGWPSSQRCARDAAAAAAIYADDATLLAPGGRRPARRPAIERFWQTGVETGIEQVELVVLDLQQRGEVAFEVGRVRAARRPRSPVRPSSIGGRYLIVHRIEADGRWRRAAEMFSPDADPRSPRGAVAPRRRPRTEGGLRDLALDRRRGEDDEEQGDAGQHDEVHLDARSSRSAPLSITSRRPSTA